MGGKFWGADEIIFILCAMGAIICGVVGIENGEEHPMVSSPFLRVRCRTIGGC